MEQQQPGLIQGIDTVIIRVTDINASMLWYTTNLGFATSWKDDKIKLVVLDTNGPTSLTLWQTDQALSINRETASYPIFKTRNADELRKVLVSRGIKADEVIKEDGVAYFFFSDPDGNILEACQVGE